MDPVATITTAVADLGPDLLAVGAVAIGVSATVLVLRKGWGFFRSLVK